MKIYGQIGLTKGDAAFQKAKEYLQKYKSLNSADQSADDLEAELEAKQEKYQRDKLKPIQEKYNLIGGTWYGNGASAWVITVNVDDQGRIWSQVPIAKYYSHPYGRITNYIQFDRVENKILYWDTDPDANTISLTYETICYFDGDWDGATTTHIYTFIDTNNMKCTLTILGGGNSYKDYCTLHRK